MTLPADLDVYISGVMFVLGAYLFALYLGLIVWTVRDIRARSRDVLAQIMVTVLVALFTVPGLLVYLLLRPHSTLAEEYERSLAEEALLQDLEERRMCPGCRQRVESDFVVCPHCHHQLRLRCVGCGRLLNPSWDVCPYCGLFREQQLEEGQEQVEAEDEVIEPEAREAPEPETLVAGVEVVESVEPDAFEPSVEEPGALVVVAEAEEGVETESLKVPATEPDLFAVTADTHETVESESSKVPAVEQKGLFEDAEDNESIAVEATEAFSVESGETSEIIDLDEYTRDLESPEKEEEQDL